MRRYRNYNSAISLVVVLMMYAVTSPQEDHPQSSNAFVNAFSIQHTSHHQTCSTVARHGTTGRLLPKQQSPTTTTHHPRRNSFFSLWYKEQDDNDTSSSSEEGVLVPECIQSTVLKQVYPSLVRHSEKYGNPNIPLGTVEGKKCKTLRRLAFQNKLVPEEMDLLTDMGFRFNNFEDVYDEADFDDCLNRLIEYEQEFKTGYQIPKKYKPDPELGAWVTLIRRIGRDNINPDEKDKLDAIGFAWVSTRKCGSTFMKNYRSIKERVEACCIQTDEDDFEVCDQDALDLILKDEEVLKWLRAQKEASALGNLSESRIQYLDELPGFDWQEL